MGFGEVKELRLDSIALLADFELDLNGVKQGRLFDLEVEKRLFVLEHLTNLRLERNQESVLLLGLHENREKGGLFGDDFHEEVLENDDVSLGILVLEGLLGHLGNVIDFGYFGLFPLVFVGNLEGKLAEKHFEVEVDFVVVLVQLHLEHLFLFVSKGEMEASLGEHFQRLFGIVNCEHEFGWFFREDSYDYSALLDFRNTQELLLGRTVFEELEVLSIIRVLADHVQELQSVVLIESHDAHLKVARAGIQVSLLCLLLFVEVEVVVLRRLHLNIHYLLERNVENLPEVGCEHQAEFGVLPAVDSY